jgi:glucose-6-phosphate isomerase
VKLILSQDVPSSEPAAARFAGQQLLKKLEAIDSKARRHGLEALDPARNELIGIGMEVSPEGRVTKNSYGVFHLAWLAARHPEWTRQVRAEAAEIRGRFKAAHRVELRNVIWAGMGGSAEDKSMFLQGGLLDGGPAFFVLDSTDPAKLKAILAAIARRHRGRLDHALKSTLVVGMAMGMTSYEPVVNLEKLARLYDRHRIDSRPNFLYMTLPGSLLDRFASARGYRRVELQLDNGNSTAGRHSGPLTRGCLYPLAFAGADLEAWVQGAQLDEKDVHTAWSLAAFLHQQGRAGRDKVTLFLSPSLACAALWTKQDFEESLGKSEELGVKIVIGERPHPADYRPMGDPRQDRLFMIVERAGEPAVDRTRLSFLKRAKYPLAAVTLEKNAPLSRYMQFIHYTVFGLGYLRRMNFVTQPAVELYKSITNPLYQNAVIQGGIERTPEWKQFVESPRQIKWRGGVTLHYDRLPCGVNLNDRDAASAYASLLTQLLDAGSIEYGELTFFGDTRYDPRGKRLRRILDRAGQSVFRSRLKIPVDIYEGPAMNHSYHEMVIGHGRCLSTVLLSRKPESIPEAGYTADYHRAQFLATQMAYERRSRLVVAISVKDLESASLASLEEFFKAVASRLPKARM